MHRDLNDSDTDGRLETEVCVVGCGVAGLTAARRLLALGHTVTLLESGGLDHEPATARLNAGENVGQAYYDLEHARLRFFGGTTAIWGGRLAELDPIDLERRDWVPNSGWPLPWDQLARYYRAARAVFGAPPEPARPDDLAAAGAPLPVLDPQKLAFGVWSFDRRSDRFVFAACRDVVAHPRATVVTHATVTNIGLDPAGRSVRRLHGRELAGLIRPGDAVQATHGLLNSAVTLAARPPADAAVNLGAQAYGALKHSIAPSRGGRALWRSAKGAARWLQARTYPLRPWALHRLGLRDLALVVRAEQSPNPESRVRLARGTDALGMRRLMLDWRITALDVAGVRGLVDLLGEELHRLGLGRVERAAWLDAPGADWRTDPLISAHPLGGYHHMGTTRMADDPRRGVTDASGRVHGVENLYVAGSSAFPTSGWANPTLTIAALSLRTADILSGRMARQAAA